jgi:hypothetical protein
VRGWVAVGTAAVLAAAPLAAAPAAAAAPGAASGTSTASGPIVDRTVRDARITEGSGLAPSPAHPGVLWTLNDSGNAPVLFALRPDGAVAAAVRLTGVAGYDWEAVAAFRDGAGSPMLAVGDIGDNRARRRSVEIVLLPEPALRDATVAPARVLSLRYPDGPLDAEALLVDDRAMYVVTKGLGGTLYRVPAAVWPDGTARSGTLERIASVPLVLVTDGVMGPGHHPVLRTYGELAVLPPVTDAVVGGTLQPLAVVGLPAQGQGEGLALTDGAVLLSSEGRNQPILRVPYAPEVAAVLGGGGAPSAGAAAPGSTARPASPTAGPSPSGSRERPADGGVAARLTSLPGLVGALAAAAVIGVLVGRRRRP